MHIAETEEQALDDCRYGLERVMDYLAHVVPTTPTEATDYEGRVKEMNETGAGVVGTPDMAIAQIQRLIDQSGGFGAYLVFGGDLADWGATLRSYELIAQYVMPHFQDQLGAAAGVLRLDRRHRPHVRQADARRDRQVPPGVRQRARRGSAAAARAGLTAPTDRWEHP